MTRDEDRRIEAVVNQEQPRLRRFIRARVADARDAEDILQEVFAELVEANRLLVPIDHVTAWLFRVARNRIIDLFRRRRPEAAGDRVERHGDASLPWEELIPSAEAGPDALYAREALIEAIEAAIDELPPDQRHVFVAHELEGRSFRALAAETGVNVNTLLARKRYAVRRLRARLADVHGEFVRK